MSSLVLPGEVIHKLDEKYKSGSFTHASDGKIRATCMGFVKICVREGINLVEVDPIRKPGVVPTAGSVVLAKVSSLTRRVVRCDVVAVDDQPLAGPFRGLLRREDIRATQRDQADPAQCYRPGDLIRARVLNLLGPGTVSPMSDDSTTAVAITNDTLRAAQAVSASVGATSDASSSASASAPTALCLLTTAEPDLGVVLGLGRTHVTELVDLIGSTAGSPLIPVGWTEMICPHTLARFPRKVARVPADLLTQLVRVEDE